MYVYTDLQYTTTNTITTPVGLKTLKAHTHTSTNDNIHGHVHKFGRTDAPDRRENGLTPTRACKYKQYYVRTDDTRGIYRSKDTLRIFFY